MHNIINWSEIEKTLSNLYFSKRSAPSYPPLIMFKILILQAWHNLNNEALEKQIARDLMFRRFIDLSLSENTPDHSSIWCFRQLLNTQGLLETLLEKINIYLELIVLMLASTPFFTTLITQHLTTPSKLPSNSTFNTITMSFVVSRLHSFIAHRNSTVIFLIINTHINSKLFFSI
ncbi:transposase, partial [Bathymodiolus heckerae thiotrophic gill symbiont]|uniref:transposase n=1 Tax=Bathymodiolus heckerae thiotrophic gill symbiont TaxID=1052212 RepID=UPI0010FE461F